MLSWNRPCPGLLATVLVLGCSPSLPASQGEPGVVERPALEIIAETLCRHTQGSFPNWPRLEAFRDYLAPEEAAAVAYVADALQQQIPREQWPKYHATAQFMATHTHCSLIHQTPDENSGAHVFTFEQRLPHVPLVPERQSAHQTPPKVQTQQWLKAFETAYEGEHDLRTVNIVLVPSPGGYVLDASIADTFAQPIATTQATDGFFQALETGDLTQAQAYKMQLCMLDAEACDHLQPFYDVAQRLHNQIQRNWHHHVTMGEVQYRYVALSHGRGYTAASFELENHGPTPLANIIMQADTRPPQRCLLQRERTRRNDTPLRLEPGTKATAYCALSDNTPPHTTLSMLWHD